MPGRCCRSGTPINLGGKRLWLRRRRPITSSRPQNGQAAGFLRKTTGKRERLIFIGPRYGLPPALSGHQTYWLWGHRGYSGNCLIVLDDTREKLEELFDSVEFVGISADNPYALEQRIPVFICRGAKFGTLDKVWPELKKWR